MHYTPTASRLAKYSDAIFVATEEVDVLLNPLESEALVVQTCVRCTVLLEGGT